ncbi:PTS mannose/fructose/sorbose/N-acetylgalactosamine transporter subunit IIC [Dellaglioa algida]|uniref:PTS mannose/fructose/sorbose/N-acetylgalactosamine transporter subunit IIC n=1 Tax=Dellaglioa algida TaxID=105612 RepID=UPI0024C47B94|nr:PTS sugar transporter subunit IIC [Dellaglioa algida]MDK1728461.1 PTS sugar transporter subunit IIC [Dellaglioa algida]MDK1736135.1 PTS sugar transporter subunit IIC [Dellaglioa algida]MDK1737826.1 PTS sugar transporter subunit IIC [Dellaglioa algida]
MLLIQAVLISLLCYLGALSTPWAFGIIGGWYTLSRPLVSGFLIGLILGDVSQGIVIGIAVQAVYIAMVTPGGQMPADLNYVAYPAIALAILSNASTGVAVTLATTIGVIGTIAFNLFQVSNSYWNHRAAKAIEAGDEKSFHFNTIWGPQFFNFLFRFVPSFLVIYFGAGFAKTMLNDMPKYLLDVMTFLGGALPALGIVMLLTVVIKKNYMWVFFLFGFVGVVFMKLNMIALAMVAAMIAVIYYFAISNDGNDTKSQTSTQGVNEDEEEF